jgi:hypothetical protein
MGEPGDVFGIDYGVAESTIIVTGRFTPEAFIEVAEKMKADFGRPEIEMHAPWCPKIRTKGRKACRCSCRPLEGAIEDAIKAERKASRGRRSRKR